MNIRLFNPYDLIPGEGWRDCRFTILGKALAERGHDVTWWTANFSHHFKKFRSEGGEDRPVSNLFRIRFVPMTSYEKNISFGRLAYEVLYSRSVFRRALESGPPDRIVWEDPPQVVGEGPLRSSVTEYIRTRGLINLKYFGKLSHEDLIRLYSICDIGLSPYVPESNVAMPDKAKAYDYMVAGGSRSSIR